MLDFESRFCSSTKIYLMHTYFIKGRTRNSNNVNKRRKWAFVTINKCNTKVSFKLYWEVLLKRQPKTCVLTQVTTINDYLWLQWAQSLVTQYTKAIVIRTTTAIFKAVFKKYEAQSTVNMKLRAQSIYSSEHSQGLHQKDYCIEFHSGVTF